MSEEMLLDIINNFFYTTAIILAPILFTALIVGVIISIFQAVTSIQEQTLVFIPKMTAVMLVLFFILPWIFKMLVQMTLLLFRYMILISK